MEQENQAQLIIAIKDLKKAANKLDMQVELGTGAEVWM